MNSIVFDAVGYDPVAKRVVGEGSLLAWGAGRAIARGVSEALLKHDVEGAAQHVTEAAGAERVGVLSSPIL